LTLISIVLPAYNEARNLARLVPRVAAAIEGVDMAAEVLVVDDGSPDDTRAVVQDLAAIHAGVRYLRLSRNFGKEAAISAGLARARGDAVILMDADGQHPVELLATFIAHWRAGSEVVYAVQRRRQDGWLMRHLKQAFYRLLQLGSHIDIPANAGDFRLLDRRAVDAMNALPERNRYMKGLYAWVGFRTLAVEFDPPPRAEGASHFGWRRLIRLGLTGYTAFSVAPLRLISVAGMAVSAAALVYGAYVVIDNLIYGADLPGWTTLVAGMMLLSGVQLISLGVIGEYLGRVFEEVKQRPLYLIAEDTGNHGDDG
jgi:polyisoprenyl-phosphate glycosyltransferase